MILFRLALDRLGALLSGRRLGVSKFIGTGDLFPVGVLTSNRFFGGVCMPSGLAGRRWLAVPLSDWSLGGGVSGRSGLFKMSSNSARWFDLSAPDRALCDGKPSRMSIISVSDTWNSISAKIVYWNQFWLC